MTKRSKKPVRGSRPDDSYMIGNDKNLFLDREIKALSNLSIKKDGKEVPVNVQISDYLRSMKLIESEELFRMYVRESLRTSKKALTEDLSRSDRDEIRKIARREAETVYREVLKEKIIKEVEKLLKGKKNQDVVLDITKKILKKFYRELYFDYTPVISRLKL